MKRNFIAVITLATCLAPLSAAGLFGSWFGEVVDTVIEYAEDSFDATLSSSYETWRTQLKNTTSSFIDKVFTPREPVPVLFPSLQEMDPEARRQMIRSGRWEYYRQLESKNITDIQCAISSILQSAIVCTLLERNCLVTYDANSIAQAIKMCHPVDIPNTVTDIGQKVFLDIDNTFNQNPIEAKALLVNSSCLMGMMPQHPLVNLIKRLNLEEPEVKAIMHSKSLPRLLRKFLTRLLLKKKESFSEADVGEQVPPDVILSYGKKVWDILKQSSDHQMLRSNMANFWRRKVENDFERDEELGITTNDPYQKTKLKRLKWKHAMEQISTAIAIYEEMRKEFETIDNATLTALVRDPATCIQLNKQDVQRISAILKCSAEVIDSAVGSNMLHMLKEECSHLLSNNLQALFLVTPADELEDHMIGKTLEQKRDILKYFSKNMCRTRISTDQYRVLKTYLIDDIKATNFVVLLNYMNDYAAVLPYLDASDVLTSMEALDTGDKAPQNSFCRTIFCEVSYRNMFSNPMEEGLSKIKTLWECSFRSSVSLCEAGDILDGALKSDLINQLPDSEILGCSRKLARYLTMRDDNQFLLYRILNAKGKTLGELDCEEMRQLTGNYHYMSEADRATFDGNVHFHPCAYDQIFDGIEDLWYKCEEAGCPFTQREALMATYKHLMAILDDHLSATNPSKRRRRALGEITCQELQYKEVRDLNITEINSLSMSVWDDCPEAIGSATYVHEAQIPALVNSLIASKGQPSAWASNDSFVRLLGCVLYGLGPDIALLNLTSDDIVTSLGQVVLDRGNYNITSLYEPMFQEWKAQNGVGTLVSDSAMTGEQLKLVHNLQCGMLEDDIRNVSLTAYEEAAGIIGTVNKCPSYFKLQLWAEKAAMVYGYDSTVANASDIARMGVVASGMTANYLLGLHSSKISTISKNAISRIPPEVFKDFSDVQLEALTYEQATYVTPVQHSQLSYNKSEIVHNKTRLFTNYNGNYNMTPNGTVSTPTNYNTTTTTKAPNGTTSAPTNYSTSTTTKVVGVNSNTTTTPIASGAGDTTTNLNKPAGSGDETSTTTKAATTTGQNNAVLTVATTTSPASNGGVAKTTGQAAQTTTKSITRWKEQLLSKSADQLTVDDVIGGTIAEQFTADLPIHNYLSLSADVKQSEEAMMEMLEPSRTKMMTDSQKFVLGTYANNMLETANEVNTKLAARVTNLSKKSANRLTNSDALAVLQEALQTPEGPSRRQLDYLGEKAGQKIALMNEAAIRGNITTYGKLFHKISEVDLETVINKFSSFNESTLGLFNGTKIKSTQMRNVVDRYISEKGLSLDSLDESRLQNYMETLYNENHEAVLYVNAKHLRNIPPAKLTRLVRFFNKDEDEAPSLRKPYDQVTEMETPAKVLVASSMDTAGSTMVDLENLIDTGAMSCDQIVKADALKFCSTSVEKWKRLTRDRTVCLCAYEKCRGQLPVIIINRFQPHGPLALCALAADLRNIPSYASNLYLFAERLSTMNADRSMDRNQMEAFASVIKVRLDTSPGLAELQSVTSAQAYAPWFAYLGRAYLDKITDLSIKAIVCRKLACLDYGRLSCEETRPILQACLDPSLGEHLSLREAMCPHNHGPGYLFCIKKEDIEILTCDAIANTYDILNNRVVDCEARSQIIECFKTITGLGLNNNINLQTLGSLICDLSDSDWNTITEGNKCNLQAAVSKIHGDMDYYLEKRKIEAGYSGYLCLEKSSATRARCYTRLEAAEKSVVCGNGGKKKRQTSPPTCEEITLMEHTSTLIPADMLGLIETSEFIKCPSTLGRINGFDEDQMKALSSVATKTSAFGDSSAWSFNKMMSAAGMVSGLDVGKLSLLPMSWQDSVSVAGKFGVWTDPEKLRAITLQYKDTYLGGNMQSITQVDLRTLGHLICGFDTSEIQSVPSAELCKSFTEIGQICSCEEGQQVEWAKRAKSCFGQDPSAWSISATSGVGCMIGGLSKEDLATLSSDQLKSIPPNAIHHIPPRQFQGFKLSQLVELTVNQIAQMTQEQYNSLDTERQDMVDNRRALAGPEVVAFDRISTTLTPGGGCGVVEASFILIIPAILAAVFRI